MQNMGPLHRLFNHGTRTRESPLGTGTRQDEIDANKSVSWMCDVLDILLKQGKHVTIENPYRSIVFYHPKFAQLITKYSLQFVYVDPCMYGLRSPRGSEVQEIWKKPTYLVTSLPSLPLMEKDCQCEHKHTHTSRAVSESITS